MAVDLRTCKPGDRLRSSHGVILEYVSTTPWNFYTYLDHVVKYLYDAKGNPYQEDSYGTRTHDGYVFAKKRIPEIDEDIVEIIRDTPLKEE